LNRSRRKGLSLIEVMISMAVLGFVLLAFMSIMTSASSLSTSTREGLLASYELQSAVEDTLSGPYTNFVNQYANGPINAGTSAQGYVTPSPSSHPLAKYWSQSSTQPGALPQEQVWIEILNTSATTTTYKMHIKWKSHKSLYQQDEIVMQRSAR
jgi:prepilin-type N-terminal cleavage/methylation domain-containing protein